MIEIFRTSVSDTVHAANIIEKFKLHFPAYKVNFDLADCDRILRIQSPAPICIDTVIEIVSAFGYELSILEDVPAVYVRRTV